MSKKMAMRGNKAVLVNRRYMARLGLLVQVGIALGGGEGSQKFARSRS